LFPERNNERLQAIHIPIQARANFCREVVKSVIVSKLRAEGSNFNVRFSHSTNTRRLA